MTRDVITVTPDTEIREAARILLHHRINGIPVVSSGKLVGIICQSDLIAQQKKIKLPTFFTLFDGFIPLSSPKQFEREMEKVAAATVEDAMTTQVTTVTPDTSVTDAATLMVDRNFHTLPVVSGSRLAGILGKEDILRIVSGEETDQEESHPETEKTPAEPEKEERKDHAYPPQTGREEEYKNMEFQTIACCTDFSENAGSAVKSAASLAKKYNAKLVVIHVLPFVINPLLTEVEAKKQEETKEGLVVRIETQMQDEYASILGNLDYEFVVLDGHVSTEILNYLTEKKIDLVVLGAYGLEGMGLVFFGSVAKRVAHKAPCSVMIIRSPGENKS